MGNEPQIVGQKIVAVRNLTDEELNLQGWDRGRSGDMFTAIVLENDTMLFASQDPEGNGPGCLFGKDPEGEFILYVEEGII